MKPVSRELLERIGEAIPADSEVIPLDWHYEDEDYNIAVLVDDGEDVRRIEDRLLDPIIDYNETHGNLYGLAQTEENARWGPLHY
jgi:hypothetical protein